MQILKEKEPKAYSRYSSMFQTKKLNLFRNPSPPLHSLPSIAQHSKLRSVQILASKSKVKVRLNNLSPPKVRQLKLLRQTLTTQDPEERLTEINNNFLKISNLPKPRTSSSDTQTERIKKKVLVEFDNQVYKQGLKKIVQELLSKKQQQHYKSALQPLVTIRPEFQEMVQTKLKYFKK